jgi:hypothetical protein
MFVIDKEVYNGPIYKYDDIKKYLKTGDIILFTCQYFGSFFMELEYILRTKMLGSVYGHAGIVIKKNNGKIYIVEVSNYDHCGFEKAHYLNKFNRGGVRIINLETILKMYYKEYRGFFAVKFISQEIPYSKIMQKLKKYKNITFKSTRSIITLALTDILISHSLAEKISNSLSNNEMICTEFLYILLYDCNVLKHYPPKLFWPHLIETSIFDKLENIKYSALYKFVI